MRPGPAPSLVCSLLVLALADPAPGQAPKDHVYKGAPGIITTGCPPPYDQIPNNPLPGAYFYYLGSTITWSINIDLDRTADVTGGTFTDVVDDDRLQLLCDPGTYTLPPGATLTRCDPGSGSPADGTFEVANITVPAATVTTITFQTRLLSSARVGEKVLNLGSFRSTATGTLQTRPTGFAAAGTPTTVTPVAPGSIPTPLTTTKSVVDLDGGDVAPGDTLEYRVSIRFIKCPDDPMIMVSSVDPLPAGLIFQSIVSCDGGTAGPTAFTCTWDAFRRELVMTGGSPLADLNGPAVMVYQVTVDPTTRGGTRLCNQAITNLSERSDDPADPADDAPTCVTVLTPTTALLSLLKGIEEVDDDDGYFEHGEQVRFVLQLRNPGRVTVTDARLRDVLPAGLTGFDPASVTVTPASGVNRSQPAPAGNGAGIAEWESLRVPAQGSVEMSFVATLGLTLPGRACNSATASSVAYSINEPSDDPATTTPDDATCFDVVPPRLRYRARSGWSLPVAGTAPVTGGEPGPGTLSDPVAAP